MRKITKEKKVRRAHEEQEKIHKVMDETTNNSTDQDDLIDQILDSSRAMGLVVNQDREATLQILKSSMVETTQENLLNDQS